MSRPMVWGSKFIGFYLMFDDFIVCWMSVATANIGSICGCILPEAESSYLPANDCRMFDYGCLKELGDWLNELSLIWRSKLTALNIWLVTACWLFCTFWTNCIGWVCVPFLRSTSTALRGLNWLLGICGFGCWNDCGLVCAELTYIFGGMNMIYYLCVSPQTSMLTACSKSLLGLECCDVGWPWGFIWGDLLMSASMAWLMTFIGSFCFWDTGYMCCWVYGSPSIWLPNFAMLTLEGGTGEGWRAILGGAGEACRTILVGLI